VIGALFVTFAAHVNVCSSLANDGRFAERPSEAAHSTTSSASITVGATVLGQTSTYIGATEAGKFYIEDLVDLGINAYRLWTKMGELEWWDDDDAAAGYPCDPDLYYGRPTRDEIKADQASGFANTIPWEWWDTQFNGTVFQWSGNSRADVIQQCTENGIVPVVVLRTVDDQGEPSACDGIWAPKAPLTQADLDEWWEHCFAIAYWLNVRHDYGVTRFEVLNEPDLASQGWNGSQAEYVQLVETAYDAVKFANDIACIETVIHAPVVSNASSSYIAAALDSADAQIAVVDYHTYSDDPTSSISAVRSTIASHNSDGTIEPIWLSEWGTYTSSYDDFDRAMTTAQQLMIFSEQGVEGVTLFGMYDWGGFSGLLDDEFRTRSETYYAYRLMTRGLKGGKDRLQYTASGLSGDVLVTRDASHIAIIVLNGGATIEADLSALNLDRGTVTVYEYSSAHKDAIVATPAMVGGRFTFTAPTSGLVLAQITPTSPTGLTDPTLGAWAAGPFIQIEWETATELDAFSFDLYRSETPGGNYVRLNDEPIGSLAPGTPTGNVYTWTDTAALPQVTYYYTLSLMDSSGAQRTYGPVSATVESFYTYLAIVQKAR